METSGPMMLRLGYDIQFDIPSPVAIVALLNVHPSWAANLRTLDKMLVEPATDVETYMDTFGNLCSRFMARQGALRLSNSTLFYDFGLPDLVNPHARELPIQELPTHVLRYLLNSRYCEVDRFSAIALELFGGISPGWGRVQAVCDWVHSRITFGYQYARPTKTALDVYTERFGVCRVLAACSWPPGATPPTWPLPRHLEPPI